MSAGLNNIAPQREFQALLHNESLCKSLLDRLESTLAGRKMRFMEVCGTHTVTIFQTGLRSILPKSITHISGPGCPVCVTHQADINLFLELARRKNIIIATFGDLLRVPGSGGFCLKHARAEDCKVEIVYSPLEALNIAKANPDMEVIFPGIGFETTAPAVAATIQLASRSNIKNFSVLSLHKLVPPVLRLLAEEKSTRIDAFLLPGHVAAITGEKPFSFLAGEYAMPSAIAGFEPVDLLLGLLSIARQFVNDKPILENSYSRVVNQQGNPRAINVMSDVFKTGAALWRGMGTIKESGLVIKDKYKQFDAVAKFGLQSTETSEIPGCQCGKVLQGIIQPPECPLFAKKCNPAKPVGPCMVSTEGSCAAYFKYGEN